MPGGEASSVGAGIALDAMTGRATQSARTTYLALLTAALTDASIISGSLVPGELTTAGYSRQVVTWTVPSGDPRQTANSATITFGPFAANPPNVTHGALVTTATGVAGGDIIYYWELLNARDAGDGESIQVAAGGLVMTAD